MSTYFETQSSYTSRFVTESSSISWNLLGVAQSVYRRVTQEVRFRRSFRSLDEFEAALSQQGIQPAQGPDADEELYDETETH